MKDHDLVELVIELREALKETLRVYIELADSGDCGFWDPQKEDHVIRASSAIKRAEGW